MVAAGVLVLWALAIETRLVVLQVVQHRDLVARAERQQMSTVPAPAKRGEIFDRNGRLLAYSVDADTIYAVPTEIADAGKTAAALCEALDDCTRKSRDELRDRLSQPRAFVYVRRRASPMQAKRVAALTLDGVAFRKESKRYYPNRELAAHLLGYVGMDNVGLDGLEATYDKTVRGREGKLLVQTDARRHVFSRLERSPTAGASLELTIDEHLQHIAEREIRAGVLAARADGGTAVIMDPHTRRDPRDGELADVQSQRLQRRVRGRAPQSRGPGSLRTGIDVQARHGVGGARREGRHARRDYRRQRRQHPLRQSRDRRHAPQPHRCRSPM